MKIKYNAPRWFQFCKVNQKKTRKIDQIYFSDLDLVEVRQLIDIFQTIYHNTIRVTEVWFLKKKNIGDGFENFHYDYKMIKGGKNDVSSTIVVNLGVFPDASEGTGEEDDEEAGFLFMNGFTIYSIDLGNKKIHTIHSYFLSFHSWMFYFLFY